MMPPTTRRGTVGVKSSGRGAWEGLVVSYGLALLGVLALGAVSYPMLAAALLALAGGAYAMIRKGVQVVRRRAHWTVRLPGTGVRLRIRVC